MRLVQLRHRVQDLTRLIERAEERHYQFPSDHSTEDARRPARRGCGASGRDRAARGADPPAPPPPGGAVAWRPRGGPGAGGARSDASSSSRSPNAPGPSSTSGAPAGSDCARSVRSAASRSSSVRSTGSTAASRRCRRRGTSAAGALAAAVGVLLATVGVLVAAVAIHGPSGVVVGVADAAMLVATLVWFSIAVARRAPREGVPRPHPNEGSSGARRGPIGRAWRPRRSSISTR